jgi:methyl-accepting chemotaxis protein
MNIKNRSLKFKLIGITFSMVLVPIVVGSVLFLYNLDQFGDMALSRAEQGIVQEAEESLQNRVAAAKAEVRGVLQNGKQAVRSLAGSVNLSRYLESKAGENEELNAFSRREVRRIVNGIVNSCRAQESLMEKTGTSVDSDTALQTAQGLLEDRITDIGIGEDGYVYVMNAQGDLLVHPDSSLVGQNVISDLDVAKLQQVLDAPSPDGVGFLNYTFEGRRKFVGYRYYPEWDWIVCGSGYWDDLTSQATAFSREKFRKELKGVMQSTTIEADGEPKNVLTRVRYLNREGVEEFKLAQSGFSDDTRDRSESAWFREAKSLEEGEVYNAGVVESEDGDVEMLIASPVRVDGEFRGVVAGNLQWSLAWSLLSDYSFGDSGYVYILNHKGLIVSHPQNDYTDRVDATDAKFGKLATIVADRMLGGEEGTATYEFRGTHKHMAYTPLQVGDMVYPMASTVSTSQFLQPVRALEEHAGKIFSNQVSFLLLGSGTFLVIALLTGYFLSRSISNRISRIIESLKGSAHQVSTASDQLSSSSQKLAEGSSEQASSLEETSSSLEEMSSQTQQNADNARSAKQSRDEAYASLQSAQQAMEDSVQAMSRISSSGEEIGKVIKTIDDIAFQTNLLALNAAVEAARAGEAGKGFAVVAEEVRNLAQRTSEEAKNTQSMIEKTVSEINNGSQLLDRTKEAFETVVTENKKVAGLIDEITAASEEQAKGIEQVNNAVAEMDKVVQQNASDAEESSSAAEELASQAKELEEIVAGLTEFVYGTADTGRKQARRKTQAYTARKPGRERKREASRNSGQGRTRNQEESHGGNRPGRGRAQKDGTTRQTRGQSEADRMIPLDDEDDFKDF